jgi:membrane protease YdiL (CAAX protease family)
MFHPVLLTIFTLLILIIALPLFSMWAGKRIRSADAGGARLLRYARTIVILWSVTALALYALRLHHLDPTYVGLRPPRHPSELFAGLITLAAPLLASASGSRRVIEGEYARALRAVVPDTLAQWIAFVPVAATAGICEEFLYRGYALTVLGALTGSVFAGAVLSSIAFGLGHAYQGRAGMVGTAVTGLLYAIVFIMTGSLYPCMLGHFVQDMVGAAVLSRKLKGDAKPRAVADPAATPG